MVYHDQRIVVLHLITFLPASRCLQVSKSKTLILTSSSKELYSNGTLYPPPCIFCINFLIQYEVSYTKQVSLHALKKI